VISKLLKQTFTLFVLVASLALLSFSIQPADAAFDMFIKIGDIKGESQDSTHKDEIDVLAWSWGLSNSAPPIGGGGGAGKANVNDFSFIKFTDLSTTDLMKGTLDGKHFDEATITVRKSGDKPYDYLKYVLKEIIITSVSTGGSGGEDRPTESVTLNFAKIETHYVKQSPDGKCTEVSVGWDIAQNIPLDAPSLGLCSALPPADTDGDGIPDVLDTDDTNPSNDFNDNGAPIPTTGTIISRGDQTLSFTDLPNPQGVQISATGGAAPAVISWCNGLHASLASGSTVNLSCGSSIVQVVSGTVDVSYTDTEGNSIDSTLLETQDFEFDALTFTLGSNAGTAVVTLTTDDGKIITITIPAGNDLTIDVDTLIFSTPDTNDSPVILEQDGEETPLDPNSQVDMDQKFVEPQLRDNLTKKMTDHFKKQIKIWDLRIILHEKTIPLLESQADKAESKGNLVKAQQLRDRAADKQDKIEILEDLISVLQVSLGLSPLQKIPVDSQDNLLARSVDGLEKRISVWDSKVVKLNKRADDLETKADKYDVQAQEKLLQGKTKQANDLEKKADNLRAEAESLRDKALVYSDLSQVLKISIDMEAESTLVSVDEENDKDENDTMFQ
jgi:type VI secretion system secreted protein Hcp